MNVRVRTFRLLGGYGVDVCAETGDGAPVWTGWDESERVAFSVGVAAAENRGHRVTVAVRAPA